MKDAPKDRWDKADVLLRTLGVLLTPLSVALVGFLGSRYLEQRQADETNMRLYAEIMSTRETADTALRQQMFNSIIKTFLNPALVGLVFLYFAYPDTLRSSSVWVPVSTTRPPSRTTT